MHYLNYLTFSIFSACLAFAVEGLGAASLPSFDENVRVHESRAQSESQSILLAQRNAKRRGNAKRSGRERNIIREKTYRGEQRKLDFDAIDIRGERNTAIGTQLGQTKASKEFDLIKVRLRWHPEMIQSTSSLETGRPR